MKNGWIAVVSMLVVGILLGIGLDAEGDAYGMQRSHRRFTPKAVVVAQKKLTDIVNGPARRRRADLVATLEELFLDFGIEGARASANDILVGRYDFLHRLCHKDRVALAPVVAKLMALFPEESGIAARLREVLPTLSKLRTDEDPVVAERAKSLIAMANGKTVGVPKATLTVWARSFLKGGRRALFAYGSLSEAQMAELRKRSPDLAALAKDESTVVAEGAKALIDILSGKAVDGILDRNASLLIEAFLANGKAGLAAARVFGKSLAAEMIAHAPLLEKLGDDPHPIVAERAKLLLRFSQGEPTPLKKVTVEAIARSFLKLGRAGLEDYQQISDARLTRLRERLPELERLAKDESKVVATRARWLIQLVSGEEVIDRQKNTLMRYAVSFLERGRDGLADYEQVSKDQVEKLKQSLPELVQLSNDLDTTVAESAKTLIDVANGMPTDKVEAVLRGLASVFLRRGRDGLVDARTLTETRLAELVERLPVLAALAQDPDAKVAERAELLMRAIEGESDLELRGATVVQVAIGFIERGRDGLMYSNSVSKRQLVKLLKRQTELELLAKDADPVVAERATALLKLTKREPVSGRSGLWLADIAYAFLKRGRAGLVDSEPAPPKLIAKLTPKLSELEKLSEDQDLNLAKRAKALLQVARGEETPGYSGDHLRHLGNDFLRYGRAGLLPSAGNVETRLMELEGKLPELLSLTDDPDPKVAAHANEIIRFINGEGLVDKSRNKKGLLKMVDAFLGSGREGLLAYLNASEEHIAILRARREELDALVNDENPRVARRAKSLIDHAEKDDGLTTDWLQTVIRAFEARGRAGLVAPQVVSPKQIEALNAREQDLERLSLDEDSTVAFHASVLLRVAHGETVPEMSQDKLRRLAGGFLENGRRGLVRNKPATQSKSGQLAHDVMGSK